MVQKKKIVKKDNYKYKALIDFTHCIKKGKTKYCRNCSRTQQLKCERKD